MGYRLRILSDVIVVLKQKRAKNDLKTPNIGEISEIMVPTHGKTCSADRETWNQ